MFNTELSNGAALNKAFDNDLSPLVHKEIVGLLNRRVADSIDLMLQAKQAHWTAKGSNFLSLHELFYKIADGASSYADLLAERVMQLGGTAEGTVQVVASISQLDPYPLVIRDSEAHIGGMSSTVARYARLVREGINECQHRGDAVSADVFTEISRATDKWLWLIDAHKQHR